LLLLLLFALPLQVLQQGLPGGALEEPQAAVQSHAGGSSSSRCSSSAVKITLSGSAVQEQRQQVHASGALAIVLYAVVCGALPVGAEVYCQVACAKHTVCAGCTAQCFANVARALVHSYSKMYACITNGLSWAELPFTPSWQRLKLVVHSSCSDENLKFGLR
jgi:hypothetical protein